MDSHIVDKVLSGQATSQEAREVVQWFEQPEGGMELVRRIDRDLQREWDKHYTQTSHPSIARRVFYYSACVILVMVLSLAGGYAVYQHYIQPTPATQQVVYTACGERTQVVLQDGTRIFLNSGSKLSFPSYFDIAERRVHLEGEAYFEVTTNPHRPFIVEMDNADITVLGTRFNTRAYANEPIRVTLDEGSVRFSAPHINDVMLKPGEVVCYDTQLQVARVSPAPIQLAGAWRNHRIEISDMPLSEVVALLERNYNIKVHVKDASCLCHSFTLAMDDRNITDVLQRMDELSPLTFAYNPDQQTVEIY